MLLERGKAEGERKTIAFVPGAFEQAPRLMTEQGAGIDAFIAAVSPMDKHGYSRLGASND